MFIADRLIYVELPKTACTHIGKLLALVVPGEQRGKHNKPSQAEFDRQPVFLGSCLLYTSPSPRDQRGSRMPSSA